MIEYPFRELPKTSMLHPVAALRQAKESPYNIRRRFPLGVGTVKTALNPISRKSMMLGMAKVVFSILLSGMMAIGRTMESGRNGYGASSGWKVF
ncbi:hypothetical protein TNCV_4693461 [Trichonephila clavipes]|uniref:Uncharacterized protein n=1 Tax=Trichonephila clavipes TaxID=2585209 RepID=A0A8X7BID9_TRICX|nr:hypothetical protein TNCV_4693461 [Trichonephila clavipes]